MGGMKIPEDLHTPIQQEILLDYRHAGGTFSDICVKGDEVWFAGTTSGVTVWDEVKRENITERHMKEIPLPSSVIVQCLATCGELCDGEKHFRDKHSLMGRD